MNERSVFLAVLDLDDPSARSAYLDRACAADPDLRFRVEQLLKAHQEPGQFMERPAPALVDTAEEPAPAERPATVIGLYKLMEQIGEGGMGLVFVAEQQHPVRRQVAVKVIKPGMDTREVIARFEAERQALALMDHPNIARVFDAGATEAGQPYFVMELVRGVGILQFCDENRLTPRERLGLFVSVCQAVQHAHHKGIIHRDLKSTNILVTLHDGTPVVKVIDFGVAKAIGQQLTDKTIYTRFAQMIGTPMYMSPEQAEMSGLDIDTRSDVYALGVLLYELLTGATPFDRERLRTAGYDEIRRIIREEEPPRPSTRFSTLGPAAATVSANRQSDPKRLGQLCRGELDWIVMKALEKDRNRRYETASGFARDVQRYLADEPVLACPPSVGYRLRKIARRNKAGVAVAALVLVFLVLLGSGVGWAVRDRESRKERAVLEAKAAGADVERLRREGKWSAALSVARRVEALLTGAGADPEPCSKFAELGRDLEMAARLEEIRAHLLTQQRGRFDWTQLAPRYAQAFRDFGIDVEALAPAEAAERIRARTIPEELAAALDDWARIRQRGQKDEAGAKRLRAVARAADPDPWRNRLRAAIESGQGTVLKELVVPDEIDRLPPSSVVLLVTALGSTGPRETAVELVRKIQQQHPDDVWTNLALAELFSQEPETRAEGIGFYRAALACRPHSSVLHLSLGHALLQQEQAGQAADAFRRASQLDPGSVEALCMLGGSLFRLNKHPEGLAEIRRAARLKPDLAAAGFTMFARLLEWDDKLSALLRGQREPGSAVERAELACTCQFRGLYATSARMYGEAFAVTGPDLTEGHSHRAAWAAVMASNGKGKDAAGLDEGDRARLRGQALIWLRHAMERWRLSIGKEPAEYRLEVRQQINCWLNDPDLACLRDPAPLGRLPAAERADWERLWRDLRQLRASAQSNQER